MTCRPYRARAAELLSLLVRREGKLIESCRDKIFDTQLGSVMASVRLKLDS
jgi:hypothetical protein